jgi:uncharacterized membrane protein
MISCHECASERPNEKLFCPDCGERQGKGFFLLSLVLPAFTGASVFLLGVAIRGMIPLSTSAQPEGILDALVALILGTTVPYFDFIFSFVGGWVATVALAQRKALAALIAGVLVAVAGLTSFLSVLGMPRGAGMLPDVHLLWLAGLALAGSMLAVFLSEPLGRFTKYGALVELLHRAPGGRYWGTAAAAFLAVALLILIYGLVVTVLVIAAVLLALYLGVRIALFFLSGGESRPREDEGFMASIQRERTTERERIARAKAQEDQRKLEAQKVKQGRAAAKHWNKNGKYAGKTDEDSRHWDNNGKYAGKTDEDGRHWDSNGKYAGRTDEDGRYWDNNGKYAGRTDEDGRQWDSNGRYSGKNDKR